MAETLKNSKRARRPEKDGQYVLWDYFLSLRVRDDFVEDITNIQSKHKGNYDLSAGNKSTKYLLRLEKLAEKYNLVNPMEWIKTLDQAVQNIYVPVRKLCKPTYLANLCLIEDLRELTSPPSIISEYELSFPVVILLSPYAKLPQIISCLKDQYSKISAVQTRYINKKVSIHNGKKRDANRREVDERIFILKSKGLTSKEVLRELRAMKDIKVPRQWTYKDIDTRFREEKKRRKAPVHK